MRWTRICLVVLALATAPTAGHAQDATASAQRFVEGLYAAHHGKGPDYLGRQAARVLSPRLRALVRRDVALTPAGDVGALDGDPICDCQDFQISHVRAEVRPAGAGRAVAAVRFRNFGRAQAVTLDLIAVGGAWRVDNVHSASIPDLADFLRKHAGGR
jgi:hypothetical protein